MTSIACVTSSQFGAWSLEGHAEGLDNSNIAITLDLYPHVLPNMQDELAGLAANLLKR